MQRFTAFLGGINVGGHRIKMDELRRIFEEHGCRNVTTFLASGNVLFEAAKRDRAALEAGLAVHLELKLGYKVPTFLRTPEEISAATRYEPYDRAELEANGHTLHVCFLHRPLSEPEQALVRAAVTPMDELHPNGSELYWLCRGSRLSESTLKWKPLNRAIGESTARNITMLRKLCQL